MKKLYIKTFGCQMNLYDSDRMRDVLVPAGYIPTEAVEEADMVILNTCHIREKASEKVFSDLGRLRAFKHRAEEQQNRQMLIAVAGCVAQAEGDEIIKRAPWVDMVVGPQTYHRLPELVARIDPLARQNVIDTEFPSEVKFDYLPEESSPRGPSAFLSIQEGCDKFCSFCVVPYTRGAEFSRPAMQIYNEAKRLVAMGTKDITLLGQNVNAWHGVGIDNHEWRLGRLIRELADIDGLKRIRYTTSHPLDMDEDLMTAHRDVDILMPYLHLPVQTGSNRILQAMNRRHTADEYRAIIDRIRTLRPDIAVSGDFIVGFPGETDKDFADTIKLVDDIGYASAYSFKYSARPGTPASDKDHQIDEHIKADRLSALRQLLDAQQLAFNKLSESKMMDILVEKTGKYAGQIAGRSPYMQAVYCAGDDSLIGKIITIYINKARQVSLSGEQMSAKCEKGVA